ncbi:DJ-1/PfpI family protein [Anaerocolumna sp. MB42-C2]|uniref:DJ-1/PfpI family protein n=1 Tax=Anaerocolumna sp. MB42-C2 TaxID=3070997 RepID=UPI0027E1ECBB|nr:DJ-1/PfpI family protein [Anaerocolumna sp. MB42-C2]WMJ89399.1 DJ-1/PfpI family protein [Anaerocolumna sp. MB42-C2]
MNINIILFHDFETLDVFGPVEVLGKLPEEYKIKFYSPEGGIVISSQGTQVVTEPLNTMEKQSILIIPGGQGTRELVSNEEFIYQLKNIAEQSLFCLTVCTGSALLAKTGLLKNRRATSNKNAFQWVMSVDMEVYWIKKARWVTDGKYYTSSGVSAGMDMALGFVADQFGLGKAKEIAQRIEYIWNSDRDNDIFAGDEI